jgi:hypothetical protein
MKRFTILFLTELKTWRHDPVTAMGGFIPSFFILIAFGLLFGGRLTFKLGLINHDQGPYGEMLGATFAEVLSPFGTPYYDILDLSEDQAWEAYEKFRLDGLWVIPEDFSRRVEEGENPRLEMRFSNYNDDRAKNHRIYAAEILWRFYEKAGYPAPPLALAEKYPLPVMIEWFPVIAVGVCLMSFMLGGIMNIFMLTYKEYITQVTLEFGMAPRSMGWVLAPKILLALIMGLLTGTVLLVVLYLWLGIWPGANIWAVWLLAGLVILFWVPLTLVFSLHTKRYFTGAIIVMLTGLTTFFVAGGIALVRSNWPSVTWFARAFPNLYAVDPLRDLILFHEWPVDWNQTLVILSAFACSALVVGVGLAVRRMRRVG